MIWCKSVKEKDFLKVISFHLPFSLSRTTFYLFLFEQLFTMSFPLDCKCHQSRQQICDIHWYIPRAYHSSSQRQNLCKNLFKSKKIFWVPTPNPLNSSEKEQVRFHQGNNRSSTQRSILRIFISVKIRNNRLYKCCNSLINVSVLYQF